MFGGVAEERERERVRVKIDGVEEVRIKLKFKLGFRTPPKKKSTEKEIKQKG